MGSYPAVTEPAPLLAYASADPAALRPGERLLWEGGHVGPAWLGRRGRPRFRITTRRAFCVDGSTRPDRHQRPVRWPFRGPVVVHQPGRRPATIVLNDYFWITGLTDWRPAARALAAVAPPGRRPPTDPRMTDPALADDDDLGLLPDERVVWAGRPRPRLPLGWFAVRPKLVTLAWMAVPALLLIRPWSEPHWDAGDVALTVAGSLWLLASVHRLFVRPWRDRRRLAGTRYVLTTRRAFAVDHPLGIRRVTFVFVDALPPTFARTQLADGHGDVHVCPAVLFERVPDAARVHAHLVDAVLAARGTGPDLHWAALDALPGTDDEAD